MRRLLILSALLALLLPASCRRPASDELYSMLDEDGCATFTLDMTDSLEYSLQLYVFAGEAPRGPVPVQLDYLSPDGKLYREDIVLSAADDAGAPGHQAALVRVLRENFRPVVYGLWEASVRVGDRENISGAGLRLYRNKR